jgi:hypothetical protein
MRNSRSIHLPTEQIMHLPEAGPMKSRQDTRLDSTGWRILEMLRWDGWLSVLARHIGQAPASNACLDVTVDGARVPKQNSALCCQA